MPSGSPSSKDAKPSTKPLLKRLLAIGVPVALLAVVYWAVIVHRGSFVPGVKHVTITPEQASQLEQQSTQFIRQDRYADALQPTDTLHQAFPDNHIYLGRLADIYNHLGRYKDEAETWEKYMNVAPTPVAACPRIGQAYWKQGEQFYPQALAAFERCLKLDPKNSDSIFFLAHALEMTGQFDRAAQLYSTGVQLSPNYTDLRVGLARTLLRLDKVDEARQQAQQVLDKDPNNRGALLAMGLIELHEDRPALAKGYLERGVKLSDTDPDFHILLARVAEKLNDNAEALRQYTRVVELRPDDQRSRARRDSLLAATKNTK